jgi:hypothetical protein
MNRFPVRRVFGAVALPACAWIAAMVLWLGAAIVGAPRAFDGRTMTLTEASAVASHADAYRLLEGGADPNAATRLRAGLVRNRESTMTPLEAATGAIRTGPVQVLIDRGAAIDERTFPVLWCGATARRNQDLLAFLESRRPNKTPVDCTAIRPLW